MKSFFILIKYPITSVFCEFCEVFQNSFFIELLRAIVSDYKLMRIFEMTFSPFWPMFPFHAPSNGVSRAVEWEYWPVIGYRGGSRTAATSKMERFVI